MGMISPTKSLDQSLGENFPRPNHSLRGIFTRTKSLDQIISPLVLGPPFQGRLALCRKNWETRSSRDLIPGWNQSSDAEAESSWNLEVGNLPALFAMLQCSAPMM